MRDLARPTVRMRVRPHQHGEILAVRNSRSLLRAVTLTDRRRNSIAKTRSVQREKERGREKEFSPYFLLFHEIELSPAYHHFIPHVGQTSTIDTDV